MSYTNSKLNFISIDQPNDSFEDDLIDEDEGYFENHQPNVGLKPNVVRLKEAINKELKARNHGGWRNAFVPMKIIRMS